MLLIEVDGFNMLTRVQISRGRPCVLNRSSIASKQPSRQDEKNEGRSGTVDPSIDMVYTNEDKIVQIVIVAYVLLYAICKRETQVIDYDSVKKNWGK